jgi:peroxiredoxin Q/BCP
LQASDAVVLGISVDSIADNAKFAQEIKASFPLLSDTTREVTRRYGLLDPVLGLARRTTYVLDKQGVIQHVETGGDAVDPEGAIQICSMLKKKESPAE